MTEETTPKGEQKSYSQADLDAAIAAAVEKETGGLKAKVDELLGEKKTAAAKAKEAEEAAQAAKDEAARKAGDIEALEKSWADKLAAANGAKDETISAQQKAIEALTIGAKAAEIAAELAVQGSASVLERIVKDRLSVEMTDNGPLVRVMDAAGKPSALSLDDLKAELSADAALGPIISGSKASGGGAAGANGGAGKLNGNAGLIAAKVPGFASLPKS
jgi:hypothetical protein